jgi:phytol kinase
VNVGNVAKSYKERHLSKSWRAESRQMPATSAQEQEMNAHELLMNIFIVAVCYIYVLICIFLSGKASKLFGFSRKSSRKLLHVLIGNLPFLIPLFTLNTLPLNFPFFVAAPFVLITFLATHHSPVRSLGDRLEKLGDLTDEGHSLGLVYYAVSYTILALVFASKPYIIAAGVLPMAYGDASAAIIGTKYGKLMIRALTKKTLEGSIAMFLVSFLTLEASFVFFSLLYSLPMQVLTTAAFGTALTAAFAEAFSPKGFDNVAVPLLGASVFVLLSGGI